MNIHLIAIFGKNLTDSPLATAIRVHGVSLTVFADAIRLNYPQKSHRLLVGLPRLLWFSFATAFRSLRSKPPADAVIVNSHFDVLAFALLGPLHRRTRPALVLPGFIYTESRHPLLGPAKLRYFRWILNQTSAVICHSRLEVDRNKQRFPGIKTQFAFYPYGVHVGCATGFSEQTLKAKTILSAGRSGRDYELLIEAVRGQDLMLQIICDQFPDSLKDKLPKNVRVLKDCYHDCYFEELEKSRFVVVPLKVSDISAGQMVLLQAMAMGKPTIISRTQTTIDYAEDGEGVLFVEPDDLPAMTDAINRLATDDALCTELGKRAARLFHERYSITAYAGHLVAASELACAPPPGQGQVVRS